MNFCHMLNRFGEFCFHSFPQNDCMFIKKFQWDKISRFAELNYTYHDWQNPFCCIANKPIEVIFSTCSLRRTLSIA